MADALNPANINALPFAGSLLALWEAGSAYRLDKGAAGNRRTRRMG